jgi:hypothetical protein
MNLVDNDEGRAPRRGFVHHVWEAARKDTGQRAFIQLRSSGVVERFCDARFEWLRGREHYLLGKRRKLLGLLGQRLKLGFRGDQHPA